MMMMGKMKDKALEVTDSMDAQAKMQYISQVMKDEECDYETAWALCVGKTDPVEPEFTLGYKMASPVWMLAMFGQFSKKKRLQARENFKRQLDEDELKLFEEYVNKDETEKQWKKAYKEEKKNKGVKE